MAVHTELPATEKLKIAKIATVPSFIDQQLSDQIGYLIQQGHHVTVITSNNHDWGRLNNIKKLNKISIKIYRRPTPLSDLITVIKLFLLFRQEQYDVVHSYTPKAGLLTAIAARIANVPLRLHTFTGQKWATKNGIVRFLLAKADRLIIKLNNQSYADSFTQRDFLIQENVAEPNEIRVLGSGSLAGVNLERFSRKRFNAQEVRNQLDINSGDYVMTFVGRLTREKGVLELLDVFRMFMERHSRVHLILVGPIEDSDVEDKIRNLESTQNLHIIGPTPTPERYLSITDVLCLPSYREGFGTVVIEAAAMEVPTVGSDIPGLRDAVVDGETGILVESKNVPALYSALEDLFLNSEVRMQLGHNAHLRCRKEFNANNQNQLISDEYNQLWHSVRKK